MMKDEKTIYRTSDEQEFNGLKEQLKTLVRINNTKNMYIRFIRVAFIGKKIVITEKDDSVVKDDIVFDYSTSGLRSAINYINGLSSGQGRQTILREVSA